ncbi:MAG: FG-GAP-like repeat-containing protein [bacterium]
MKSLSLVVLLSLVFAGAAIAQQLPFSKASVTLPQLAYSACAWGDYDHDGDLDLALSGVEGNNPLSKIFRNDNGNFTDIQADLLSLHYGSVEWGDFDTDGDLDLLVTGIESNGAPHTVIYKNTNGSFADAGVILPGIIDGQASWGDFNNDGNLDILLAGSGMAKIFRNEGNGQFTDINAPFPNLEAAMCSWNDYNSDGQADVLVCGNTGGGMVSKLFKNNHGIFSEVIISPEPFTGLYGGSAKWADMDNDGDQDLVIAGMDLYVDGYFIIYRNDGTDHFTKFQNTSATLLNPYFDLGDYDADGLIDIALMGTISGCGGPAATRLLKNLGSMNFEDVSTLLPGFKLGGLTWGDYNNDGYNDLLFTGLDVFEVPKTEVYLNNLGDTSVIAINTPPSPPLNPGASMEAGKLTLHWNSSFDAQTPKNALTYNVRIGTLPDSHEIMSPLAVLYNGYRTIAAPGNASADTSWIITGIPSGTYYFSVQAIDNGFMPGAFSSPYMFSYAAVGVDSYLQPTFSITPNPCHDRLTIHDTESINASSGFRILNASGKIMLEGINSAIINVTSWPEGIYFLQKTSGRETTTVRFFKN